MAETAYEPDEYLSDKERAHWAELAGLSFCVVKAHPIIISVNYQQKKALSNLGLLGFVCQSISLQIFLYQCPDFFCCCFQVERSLQGEKINAKPRVIHIFN